MNHETRGGGKERGKGRPRKDNGDVLDKNIAVRLKKSTYDGIRMMADRDGKPLGRYVRNMIENKVGDKE